MQKMVTIMLYKYTVQIRGLHVNFDLILAAKAQSLGVPKERILWVLAQRMVSGEIEMEDDQLSVLMALTTDDVIN